MVKKLKYKEVKGRIKILKVISYKGSMVYLRQIDEDIFMYDLVFKGEIYSSYLVIKPRKGETKLSELEVNKSAALIFTGAIATIDHLLGKKVDKETEAVVKTFEGARKQVESLPN
ncbi:hypothetical protein FJY90_02860 [Candidatus Gottesmanbacteria bacterium]|nr:hypothetical protein [Candidatus Gottesmanbacteria bacterium]